MTWKYITSLIMVAGVALWIGWDLIVATNRTRGDTISEITLAIAMMVSLLPVALGILVGHLLGSGDWRLPVVNFVRAYPLVPFLISVPIGVFCWPQLK